jgi:hypothetical protein
MVAHFVSAQNIDKYDGFQYIYPKPNQLIEYYGKAEQTVKDSLEAHGFTLMTIYGKASNRNYKRFLYARDCTLGSEWDNPSMGSSTEGISLEFTSINGQVIDPAIEFVRNDYGKRYLDVFVKMGYNSITKNPGYANLPRYYWMGYTAADGKAYYKYQTQKKDGKRIVKTPQLNKLYIDSYDLLGTKFFGGPRLNIGVRMATRYRNPLLITADSDDDMHKGESLVWNINDDGNYVPKFSKEMVERQMQMVEDNVDPKLILAKVYNDALHHIFYQSEYQKEDQGRLKTFKFVAAIDVTNLELNPFLIKESDSEMMVKKGPDGKHIIMSGHVSNEGGSYFFVSFNIETGKFDTDEVYDSKQEFSPASDGYVIDTDWATKYYDYNGLLIREKSKEDPSQAG